MLTICLLAWPWMADPTVTAVTTPGTMPPTPTCSRPLVKITQPSTVSALSPTEIADSLAIATLLRRWERSVQSKTEWSRSQREEFRRRMKQHFNEHTVAAAEQMTGSVKRDWLCETYDWRLILQSSEQICLEATPRDETEKLFYGSIRVWLNADSSAPEQIVIVSRNQVHRVAWQSENFLKGDVVRLVHFENDVPPAPGRTVRTANARID